MKLKNISKILDFIFFSKIHSWTRINNEKRSDAVVIYVYVMFFEILEMMRVTLLNRNFCRGNFWTARNGTVCISTQFVHPFQSNQH